MQNIACGAKERAQLAGRCRDELGSKIESKIDQTGIITFGFDYRELIVDALFVWNETITVDRCSLLHDKADIILVKEKIEKTKV